MGARIEVGERGHRRTLGMREFLAIYLRDEGLCQICREPVGADTVTIDHIRPFSMGGSCDFPNLRLAHLTCNSSRNTRVTWDYWKKVREREKAVVTDSEKQTVTMPVETYNSICSLLLAFQACLDRDNKRLAAEIATATAEIAALKAQQAAQHDQQLLSAPRRPWWRVWGRR